MNKYFPKILNSTKALACGMKMIWPKLKKLSKIPKSETKKDDKYQNSFHWPIDSGAMINS
jgi:hypothetical protein